MWRLFVPFNYRMVRPLNRDTELDRLKAAQQVAYERKQCAYEAQQSAWEDRRSAGDRQNRAYEAQQAAYDCQNAAWNRLQAVKSANNGRIESLNAQQERAYQNMKSAFESASAAHDRRDGASARSYADQGHAYKAESQRCVAERRQLVAEIRDASAELRNCKPATERAKSEFQAARTTYQSAKQRHERLAAEFKSAKADFERAKTAFEQRLAHVRAQRAHDNRDIAVRAGVPYQYLDDVRVRYDADGVANIYFGGVGAPDGPGHGHYAIDRSGKVTYKRDPFDPHGSHNFTDWQADYADAVRTEAVFGSDEFSFRCKYHGYNALVETGYDSQTSRQTINIYYGGLGDPLGAGHGHDVAYRNDPLTMMSVRRPTNPR